MQATHGIRCTLGAASDAQNCALKTAKKYYESTTYAIISEAANLSLILF